MRNPLYVAAGGGGDALAALMLHRATVGDGRPPVVVSYSWDRYLIDPAPGPRRPGDFQRLRPVTEHCWEVGPSSVLAAGVSGLALLARHTDARFLLMDPAHGVVGMHRQLTELVDLLHPDEVVLVDVGGDVIARGDEPTLLSPLGDALALAAVAGLAVPVSVAVLGPGLDGELPPDQVRAAMAEAGAEHVVLRADHVDPYLSALRFHPSEATTLIAAAAKQVAGRVEIRDSGVPVELTPSHASASLVSHEAVFRRNGMARALVGTRSFAEAEAVVKGICGRTELDHERRKAAVRSREPRVPELAAGVAAYCDAAARRGIDLLTFRRLAEAVGSRRYDPPTIRELAGDRAFPDLPLCRTRAGGDPL